VETPDVQYARSGDVAIAYQTIGDGPVDLVFVRGFAGDLLSVWEQPLLVRFVRELASFTRLTLIDKRGTGLSDRVREVRDGWGRAEFLEELLAQWAPTKAHDPGFHRWFVNHMRRGLSPGSALAFFRMMMASDVSDVLPAVRVPTVVLASPAERGAGEFFAQRIRGARLVELPNDAGIYHWVEPANYDVAMRETRALVEHVGRPAPSTRVLSTVLFTDLVGSTEQASALGDRAWREVLARHHAAIRRRLGEHRGEEVDTAGDGFFATFDGPGRAIECARSIRQDLRGLALEVQAGIHTGECEVSDGKVT